MPFGREWRVENSKGEEPRDRRKRPQLARAAKEWKG